MKDPTLERARYLYTTHPMFTLIPTSHRIAKITRTAMSKTSQLGAFIQVLREIVDERSGAEGLDLGIEGGADQTDLALLYRGDPERLGRAGSPRRGVRGIRAR